MRARLALQMAGIDVELREVLLRDKPQDMLDISPKGTVPVLQLTDGQVIDESLDIVNWALTPDYNDTDQKLLDEFPDQFIYHLNRYKYPSRYEGAEPEKSREACEEFLGKLNALLVKNSGGLSRDKISAMDIIIFPFIRQFRIVDNNEFDRLPLPALHHWFTKLINSDMFEIIMVKHDPWASGQDVILLRA